MDPCTYNFIGITVSICRGFLNAQRPDQIRSNFVLKQNIHAGLVYHACTFPQATSSPLKLSFSVFLLNVALAYHFSLFAFFQTQTFFQLNRFLLNLSTKTTFITLLFPLFYFFVANAQFHLCSLVSTNLVPRFPSVSFHKIAFSCSIGHCSSRVPAILMHFHRFLA